MESARWGHKLAADAKQNIFVLQGFSEQKAKFENKCEVLSLKRNKFEEI